MESKLDPVIRSKLLEFRSRFRLLVLVRGLCCVLLALLGGLLVHSVIDYLVVMEDRTRYVLSSVVYLFSILIIWILCVRPLLRVIDYRELAAMIEREEPSLKSKLLSAVELAEEEREHESDDFRAQSQLTVIEDLRLIIIDKVLPIKLLQVWLGFALVLILFTGVLAASESGRTLLLRALMPLANIDRVSRNQILVLSPQEGNGAVPEYDEIQIRIRVQGPKIMEPPYLLVERSGESAQRALFVPDNNPDANDEYTTSIAVESQDITYRVYAGDAVSRRYTLISRQRPRVVKYGKTFIYPEYSERPTRIVEENNGDISALIGTKVKLTLHLNQQVETAAMNLVSEKATNKLDFVRGVGLKEWVLDLPLQESGVFKINLMTAEKLGNKSPVEYSIDAEPDLFPTVDLEQPGAEVTARPEDFVSIVGKVKDDIGLARWEQLFKADKADWIPVYTNQFHQPLITNSVVKLDWDLLRRSVKVGDTVLTKIAVVDRKGNRTESRPVRVKVDSALFEVERIGQLNDYRLWLERLNEAVTKSLEFCDVLPNKPEALLLPGQDAARQTKAMEALEKLGEAKSSWRQVVGGMPAVIRKARSGREIAGLGLIGRLGGRLESDWFPRIQMHLMPLEGIVVDPRVKAHFELLPDTLKSVHMANNGLKDTARIWLAADESAVAIDLLDYIHRAAEQMHRVAGRDKNTDDGVWARLLRRQASACKELATAQDVLKALASRLDDDRSKVLHSLHDDLKKVHETLTAKHTKGEKPDSTLLTLGLRWSKTIAEARDILRPLARELAEDAARAHEKLENSVSSTADIVRRLINALEANEEAEKNLAKAIDAGENVLSSRAKLAVTGELLDLEWIVAQKGLRGRARMEESGKVSSAIFVSDVAQAAAAIESVREGVEAGRNQEEVKSQIKGIADALTILEVAHDLALLEESAKSLANRERWEQKSTDANSLRPRDWLWLAAKLKTSPKKLREAGLAGEGELGDLVRGAAVKDVSQEMELRQAKAGFFGEPTESKTSE